MAENKTIDTGNEDFDKLLEAVNGHDHIELEDADGKVWKFGYNRAIVRKMEHDGFNPDDVAKLGGNKLTDMEKFWKEFAFPAFKNYQPKGTEEEFWKVIESVPDKAEFTEYLLALYMQPILSITTNPTQSRMKFRLV